MTEKFRPPPFFLFGGQRVTTRHDAENCKRRVIGLPELEADPNKPVQFVSIAQFAREVSKSTRQIGRYIKQEVREMATQTSQRPPAPLAEDLERARPVREVRL